MKVRKIIRNIMLLLLFGLISFISINSNNNIETKAATAGYSSISSSSGFKIAVTSGNNVFVDSGYSNLIDSSAELSPGDSIYVTVFAESTNDFASAGFTLNFDKNVFEAPSAVAVNAEGVSDETLADELYALSGAQRDDDTPYDWCFQTLSDYYYNNVIYVPKKGKKDPYGMNIEDFVYESLSDFGRTYSGSEPSQDLAIEGTADAGLINLAVYILNDNVLTLGVANTTAFSAGTYVIAKLKFKVKDTATQGTGSISLQDANLGGLSAPSASLQTGSYSFAIKGASESTELATATVKGNNDTTTTNIATALNDSTATPKTTTVTVGSSSTTAALNLSVADNGKIKSITGATGSSSPYTVTLGNPGTTTTVTFVAESNSGSTTETYEVKIKRSLRSDKTLNSVTIKSNGTTYNSSNTNVNPSGTYSYSSKATSIDVTPNYPSNTGIKSVTVNGSTFSGSAINIPYNTLHSLTKLTIKVTAEDDSTQDYTINLSEITVEFNPTIEVYSGASNLGNATYNNSTSRYELSVPYSSSGTANESVSLRVSLNGYLIGFSGGTKTANTINCLPKSFDSSNEASFVVNLEHATTHDTQNYDVVITRQPASTDATLKNQTTNLIVSKTASSGTYNGSWNSEKTLYTVSTQLECTDISVYVNPTLNDSVNARWSFDKVDYYSSGQARQIIFDANNADIDQTSWTIKFYVKPENSDPSYIKEYSISITRKAANHDSSATFAFEFDSEPQSVSPSGSGNEINYYLGNVPYSVKAIKYTPTLGEPTYAKIDKGAHNNTASITMSSIPTGVEQTYTVKVTAQDKSFTTYNFIYTRLAAQTNTDSVFAVYATSGATEELAYSIENDGPTLKTYSLRDPLPYQTNQLYIKYKPEGSLAKAYFVGTAQNSSATSVPSSNPIVTGNNFSSLQTWPVSKLDAAHDVYYTYCVVAESGAITNFRIKASILAADTTNTITISVVGATTGIIIPGSVPDPSKPDVYQYIVGLDDSYVNISIEKGSESQTITYNDGSGNKTWPSGGTLENVQRGGILKPTTINITVDPEAQATSHNKTYILNIYQVDNRSDNNNYNDVRVMDSNNENKATLSSSTSTENIYIAIFPYAAENYEIQVDFADSNAYFSEADKKKLLGSTSSIQNTGMSSSSGRRIDLTVYAENGTPNPQKITILIYREDPDTRNTLKDIKVNGVSITGFNPSVKEYTVNVARTYTNNVTFSQEATSPKAKVVPNVTKNSAGNIYTYTCSVTPEAGGAETYTVNVYCADNTADVSDIKIFDSSSYSFEALDKNSSKFVYNPSNNQATVEYAYNPDSKVYVSVLMESSTAKVYGLIAGSTTEWNNARKDIELVSGGQVVLDISVKTEFEALKNDPASFNYRLILKMDGPDRTDTLATFKVTDSNSTVLKDLSSENAAIPQNIVIDNLNNAALPLNLEFTLSSDKAKSICTEFSVNSALSGPISMTNGSDQINFKTFNILVQPQDSSMSPKPYKISLYRTSASDMSTSTASITVTAMPSATNLTPAQVKSGNDTNNISLAANDDTARFDVVRGSALASTNIEVFNGATSIYSNTTDSYPCIVPNGSTYSVVITVQAADYSSDATHKTIYRFDVTRAALPKEAGLANIKVQGTTNALTNITDTTATNLPTDTCRYSLDQMPDDNGITLVLTKKDQYSKITTTDEINEDPVFDYEYKITGLRIGNNQRRVIVTAQDGVTKKYYVINIFIQASVNVTNIIVTNNETSGVETNRALSPVFNKEVSEYRVDVPFSDSSEKITVAFDDAEYITCEINGIQKAQRDIPLSSTTYDDNYEIVTIKLWPKKQDGTPNLNAEVQYTLKIYRPRAKDGKLLLDLTINGEGLANFSSSINDYNIPVAKGTRQAVFADLQVSDGASYTLSGNTTLYDSRKNTISVSVYAQSDIQKTDPNIYTFNIYPADQAIDSIEYIKLLENTNGTDVTKIENNTPAGLLVDFDPSMRTYSGDVLNSRNSGCFEIKTGVSSSKIYINDIKFTPNTSRIIKETKAFDEGYNEFNIYLLNEYGNLLKENGAPESEYSRYRSTDYIVKVNRKELSHISILKVLEVTKGNVVVPFNEGAYEPDLNDSSDKMFTIYNVEGTVNINGIPYDSAATVTGTGSVNTQSVFTQNSSSHSINVTCIAEDGHTKTNYKIILYANNPALDNDNTIDIISVYDSEGTYYVSKVQDNPILDVFNESIHQYQTLVIPYTAQSFTIAVTLPQGSPANVYIEGIKESSKQKSFSITPSMRGLTKTYKVQCESSGNRQKAPEYLFNVSFAVASADSSIVQFQVNGVTVPGFDANELIKNGVNRKTYSTVIKLPFEEDRAYIYAEPNDYKATIIGSQYNFIDVEVIAGRNQAYMVECKAEDGTSSYYNITIYRETKDPYLINLECSETDILYDEFGASPIEFNKDIKKYTVKVPYAARTATLIATTDNREFRVSANPYEYTRENNLVTQINVTDLPEGSSKTVTIMVSYLAKAPKYTVFVERASVTTTDSSVTDIKVLNANNTRNYVFNSKAKTQLPGDGTEAFEVDNSQTQLKLDVTPSQRNATYEIHGAENLKSGEYNKVTVFITSPDKSTMNYYEYNVYRKPMEFTVDEKGYRPHEITPIDNDDDLDYVMDIGKESPTSISPEDIVKVISHDPDQNISVSLREPIQASSNELILDVTDGYETKQVKIVLAKDDYDWDFKKEALSYECTENEFKKNYSVQLGTVNPKSITGDQWKSYIDTHNDSRISVEVVSDLTKDNLNQVVLKVTKADSSTDPDLVVLNLNTSQSFLNSVGGSWWIWLIVIGDIILLTAILISVNRDKYGHVTKKRKEI